LAARAEAEVGDAAVGDRVAGHLGARHQIAQAQTFVGGVLERHAGDAQPADAVARRGAHDVDELEPVAVQGRRRAVQAVDGEAVEDGAVVLHLDDTGVARALDDRARRPGQGDVRPAGDGVLPVRPRGEMDDRAGRGEVEGVLDRGEGRGRGRTGVGVAARRADVVRARRGGGVRG
jgi:hypothetical protein